MTDGNGNLVAGGGTLSPPITAGTPNSGKLTFPAGSGASQTITFTPPATSPAGVTPPASLAYQLLTPVAVGTPPPGHTASLGAIYQNTTTVQVASGCTTTATHTVPWNGSQTYVSQVKAGETGAVTIVPTPTLHRSRRNGLRGGDRDLVHWRQGRRPLHPLGLPGRLQCADRRLCAAHPVHGRHS